MIGAFLTMLDLDEPTDEVRLEITAALETALSRAARRGGKAEVVVVGGGD